MNTVKAVIFIACIIGVITSMTDIATPEGTLKKQLRSVLAVILLLAVITPVMGHGFKVTLATIQSLQICLSLTAFQQRRNFIICPNPKAGLKNIFWIS